MSFLSPKKATNGSLGNSGANHRVRWGSLHIRLPFPNKEYSDLAAPGDMWKVPLQIGVETKVSIKIGSDQEGVVIDSYEGIEYLQLQGTRLKECSLNVHIGGIDCIPTGMYRQCCIKFVHNSVANPSPPKVAMYAACLGLKHRAW